MASVNAASLATYLGKYLDHFAILGAFCSAFAAFIVGRKMLSITLRLIRRSFAVDLKKHGRWAGTDSSWLFEKKADARARAQTHTHTHARTHAHTHTHRHTYTHTHRE